MSLSVDDRVVGQELHQKIRQDHTLNDEVNRADVFHALARFFMTKINTSSRPDVRLLDFFHEPQD